MTFPALECRSVFPPEVRAEATALSDLPLIEFGDAEGVLLVRLFGFELQELIRYQDVGMMVLQAPQS